MSHSLTIYLAAGSLFAGLTMGWHSEKCGVYQPQESGEFISIVIGWPAVIGMLAYDFETRPLTCKDETK